jgi:hypothetical protein
MPYKLQSWQAPAHHTKINQHTMAHAKKSTYAALILLFFGVVHKGCFLLLLITTPLKRFKSVLNHFGVAA